MSWSKRANKKLLKKKKKKKKNLGWTKNKREASFFRSNWSDLTQHDQPDPLFKKTYFYRNQQLGGFAIKQM